MSTAFALSCLSRLIVGLLVRTGVTDIVVSPGSRSTPYLSAALERKQLRVHVVVDERSAAYMALGLARARGVPVALLCTSGTAAANYLPAIIEARLTETPLIVLTADRPLSLQACSSAQTIDQTHLFGCHVLGFASLTVPSECAEEFRRVRRRILSTLALAQGCERGPVHLNLHTPTPLELVTACGEQQASLAARIEALVAETNGLAQPSPSLLADVAIGRLVTAVEDERRGIVTCGFDPNRGALDPHALARFARATGYPILLDAAHPLRFDAPAELRPYLVAPFEPLLRIDEWHRSQAPKLVIQIGRPLTSSTWESWLGATSDQTRVERVLMLARRGWPDPTGRAELVGHGDPSEALFRASGHLEASPPRSSGWGARWFRAAAVLRESAAAWSSRADSATGGLGELRAVLTTLEAQPEGARLVIGNSLPIRELDLLAPPNVARIHAEALRGASGIDGVISTTAGFALANDRPTTLLIGDISFLHDVGGLWSTQAVSSPLAVVVLNNGGGRIFEQLPIAKAVSEEALAYWTTPQQLDLSAAARLYGIAYLQANSRRTLAEALGEAHSRPSTTMIDVDLKPDSARRQSAEYVDVVRTALLRAGLLAETAET
jgi:2-succinyl-5-enolpyruvyl-6-hydroxy-3-cyclohexene-1-carboxylate synthase